MHDAASMPRDVVIAGAGNAAKVLFDCLEGDDRWRPVAFIDHSSAGSQLYGLPVLHPDDGDKARSKTAFMAVSSPPSRRQFVERLAHLELIWTSFIDRRSYVSRKALIGPGSFIHPFATIGPGTTLGAFAYVGLYAAVGASAVLGDYTTLAPRASAGTCKIGDGCEIGFNSACLDGSDLGEGVVLAPYTWVRKVIPSRLFVAGNPARIVRSLP